MDMFKFHDLRFEKANTILRYRKLERITTLFRFAELCFFLFIVSKFSNQFPFSFKSPGKYFRGISVILVSPRFFFVVGNIIILVLLLIFSAKNSDVYDEYVEKCPTNEERCITEEKKATSNCHKYGVCFDERMINRSCSDQNIVKVVAHGHRLRRSMPEKYMNCCQDHCGSAKAGDDMSDEEFRQMVEAFIARQQKFLREEVEETT